MVFSQLHSLLSSARPSFISFLPLLMTFIIIFSPVFLPHSTLSSLLSPSVPSLASFSQQGKNIWEQGPALESDCWISGNQKLEEGFGCVCTT